jgi:hypothetical protein
MADDEVMTQTLQARLAQARGMREITLLILKGLADSDPIAFAKACKVIAHKVANMGG